MVGFTTINLRFTQSSLTWLTSFFQLLPTYECAFHIQIGNNWTQNCHMAWLKYRLLRIQSNWTLWYIIFQKLNILSKWDSTLKQMKCTKFTIDHKTTRSQYFLQLFIHVPQIILRLISSACCLHNSQIITQSNRMFRVVIVRFSLLYGIWWWI